MKDRSAHLTVDRRAVLAGIAATTMMAPSTRAQQREVQMAFIAPLSGPWARQGELMKKDADMAVEDVNAAGGIQLRGGPARLRLVVADGGAAAEKSKRLSSFATAVTAVTASPHADPVASIERSPCISPCPPNSFSGSA